VTIVQICTQARQNSSLAKFNSLYHVNRGMQVFEHGKTYQVPRDLEE